MKRKTLKLTSILFTLLLSILYSESVDWDFGLSSRYGNGQQSEDDYIYSEQYLNFNASLQKWNLSSEIQYTNPPEFGFAQTGFRNLTLTYSGDNISADFGHIKGVIGNGLSLNLFDIKEIDFDNRPIGMKIRGNLSDQVEILAIAGRNESFRFYSPNSDIREPDGKSSFDVGGTQLNVLSTDGSWTLSPYVVYSRLYSEVKEYHLNSTTFAPNEVILDQHASMINPGVTFSYFGMSFDVMIEMSEMVKRFDVPIVEQEISQGSIELMKSLDSQHGNAYYLQLNWYPEWFTVLAEYRRYQWGIEPLQNRSNLYRQALNAYPFQMGPIGMKQHDISLLANRTHPVNYGDEVGINLDLKYSTGNWIGTLNYVALSQTSVWNENISENLLIPKTAPKYLPFTEYYFELEYNGYPLTNRFIAAMTQYTESISDERGENFNHITITPMYMSYRFGAVVLNNVLSWQNSNQVILTPSGDLIEEHDPFQSLQWIGSIDLKGKWSFSVIYDRSDESGETESWLSGEITYKHSSKLRLRGSYGAEKGGIRCTGGVCRYISPFEGGRLFLEYRL